MNSAEKKAQEPSMDDIISSIRNIIADDTQESAPEPSAENSPAPVIQLTENQIAEPVTAPAIDEMPVADSVAPVADSVAPVAAPDVAPAPQPAAATPVVEAPAASAIGMAPVTQEPPAPPVPPLATAQVAPPAPTPVTPVAPEPVAVIESAPVANAPETLPPVAATSVPVPDPTITEMPSAEQLSETVAPVPVPVLQTPSLETTPAPIEKGAVADTLAPMGDMAGAVAETPREVSNDLAAGDPVMSAVAEPMNVASDPVEQMMQDTASEPGDVDAASNDVDPERILEGMESPSTELAPLAEVEPEPEVGIAVSPAVLESTPEDPVVLDASQVTPEDAAAITAVAAATSDALAGKAAPVEKQGGESFEDSVKEMLKPMIREWLDDNMPRILEGAIKEEVKEPGNDGA